MINCQ